MAKFQVLLQNQTGLISKPDWSQPQTRLVSAPNQTGLSPKPDRYQPQTRPVSAPNQTGLSPKPDWSQPQTRPVSVPNQTSLSPKPDRSQPQTRPVSASNQILQRVKSLASLLAKELVHLVLPPLEGIPVAIDLLIASFPGSSPCTVYNMQAGKEPGN